MEWQTQLAFRLIVAETITCSDPGAFSCNIEHAAHILKESSPRTKINRAVGISRLIIPSGDFSPARHIKGPTLWICFKDKKMVTIKKILQHQIANILAPFAYHPDQRCPST